MLESGPLLLASDASHYYANLLRRSPFSITVDAVDTLNSYAEMLRLAPDVGHIISGHDPKVRGVYPAIIVGGVELTLLHVAPKPCDLVRLASGWMSGRTLRLS